MNPWLWIGIGLFLTALVIPRSSAISKHLAADHMARHAHDEHHALDLRYLLEQSLRVRCKILIDNLKAQIGSQLPIKVLVWVVSSIAVTLLIRYFLPELAVGPVFFGVLLVLLIAVVRVLQILEYRIFMASFPDALNLLTSAISSGESLMQAVIFVGNTLDNKVGHEFKLMGQRLSIGQSPEEVLKLSCKRFPYPPFYFFAMALRVNINRGGQLRDMIHRLNRVLFNSRAMAKKKNAMTSEARTSAKIVSAIPFIFLLMMRYMAPENFDFVMHNEAGRPILYYMLISEVLGIGVVWALMKSVRL